MASITQTWGSGGIPLAPQNDNAAQPSLATVGRDVADDFETLRAQFNLLLAKLDADAGVTDTNYASTLEIAAGDVKTKKV
jgi:hypothetical protein